MDILSIALLLVTGVAALFLSIFLFLDYFKNKKMYHLMWAISMLVLFLTGLLLILFDWAIIFEPIIPVIAAIIPAFLAVGVLYAVYEDKPYGMYWLLFSIIMIVVLAIFKFDVVPGLAANTTPVVMGLHAPSGLIIVLLPLLGAIKKEYEMTAIFFALGGITISLGGMLLAFLMLGVPVLDLAGITAILPLVLLITAVFFLFGMILPTKWKVDIPFLKK
ncbi:MAG: hypothetical protein ACTSUB_04745 [Candidatus Thorarchaeota archaeon]